MPKPKKNKSPKNNPTLEKLRATPFTSVEDLNRETENIRLAVWRRFTEGAIIDEFLTKPESAYLKEEWKAGLVCFLGNDYKNSI